MDTPYRKPQVDPFETPSLPTALRWEVSLEILRGRAKNTRRRIQSTAYLIGSATDCDLVLGDDRFADVHACLLLRGDGVWLRHLGFAPEITVNGTNVGRILLADGDRIRTGPFQFRVRIHRRDECTRVDDREFDSPAAAQHLKIHAGSVTANAVGLATDLLADIRAAIQPVDPSVRLFAESTDGLYRAPNPVLPAIWVTSTRQAKGA